MVRRNNMAQQQGEDTPLIVQATPIDASEAGAGGLGVTMSHQAMEADVVLDSGRANAAVPVRVAAAAAQENAKQVLTKEASEALKGSSSAGPADVESGKKEEESSGPSLFTILLVVISFIAADAGKPVFEKMSLQSEGSLASSMLLNSIAVLNILLAVFLSVYYLGARDAFRQLFDKDTLYLYILPSAFFSASQLFTVAQNAFLGPALRKVFQQLRIPITALMGRFIMGHGYSTMQWLLMTAVLLALPAFMMSQTATGGLELSNAKTLVGLLFSIVTSIMACLGSIFAEKYTKAGAKTPFYVQKFQIEVWTLAAGMLGLVTLQPLSGGLGDLVTNAVNGTSGWNKMKANWPGNYKALHSTVDPMHTAMPWTNAPADVPSMNKFDTKKWESKHGVPTAGFALPAELTKGLTGTDLAEMEKLIKKFAAVKQSRASADFKKTADGKQQLDVFGARSELDSVKAFVQKVNGEDSVTAMAAQEQKFFFKHGFGLKKAIALPEELTDNFVFTFGQNEAGEFKSLAAYQRPSPRTVFSDVLSVKGEGAKRAFTNKAAAYFTGEQNVAESSLTGNPAAQGLKKVTTQLMRKLKYEPTTKKVAVTYEAVRSFVNSAKETCTSTVGKTVTLQCAQAVDYPADVASYAAQKTQCSLVGAPEFQASAMTCKPKGAKKEEAAAPVKGAEHQAKFDEIMATKEFALKPFPAEVTTVTAWSYPGMVGAGVGNLCDRALCKLSDTDWSTNFGYMANNFHNNPSLKIDFDQDKLNPFAASEIHGYTRNPMPVENFNALLLLAVASSIAQSWLSGILSKVLSSLWKNLCQAAALALVVIVQKLFINDYAKDIEFPSVAGGSKWPETLMMTLLVLLTVFAFGQAPKAKKH